MAQIKQYNMNNEDITTPQETQEEFPKQESLKSAKKINYLLLGLAALIIGLVGFYILTLIQPEFKELRQLPIPFITPLFLVLSTFVSFLISVAILQLSTRILTIQTRSWRKAFFSSGLSFLAGIVLAFIFLPFDVSVFSMFLKAIILIAILFVILMKTYDIRLLRTLGLIFIQILVMIVLAIVVALLFTLFGFGVGSFFKPF